MVLIPHIYSNPGHLATDGNSSCRRPWLAVASIAAFLLAMSAFAVGVSREIVRRNLPTVKRVWLPAMFAYKA